MDWYFCQQCVAESRVFGLAKGLLEVQLRAEEWATPFFGEPAATLHEDNRLSGTTARQKKPPGKTSRWAPEAASSSECSNGAERRQWSAVLQATTTNTVGDEHG